MKEIRLTQGQFATVDDCIFDEINQFRWYAAWSGGMKSFYAQRAIKGKTILMHREIMKAPSDLCVDHKNGNTLNNTIDNLRLASFRQNNQNLHNRKSSIYPGVGWHERAGKWIAQIKVNKKSSYLGLFVIESDAFRAYINACQEHGFCVDQMIEKFGEML